MIVFVELVDVKLDLCYQIRSISYSIRKVLLEKSRQPKMIDFLLLLICRFDQFHHSQFLAQIIYVVPLYLFTFLRRTAYLPLLLFSPSSLFLCMKYMGAMLMFALTLVLSVHLRFYLSWKWLQEELKYQNKKNMFIKGAGNLLSHLEK